MLIRPILTLLAICAPIGLRVSIGAEPLDAATHPLAAERLVPLAGLPDSDGSFYGRFSRDGESFVTPGYGKSLQVWDAVSGKRIKILKQPEKTYAFDASFSARKAHLLTCGPFMKLGRGWVGGIVRVWKIDDEPGGFRSFPDGREVFRFVAEDHLAIVSFSKDDRYISCISSKNRFYLIDTNDPRADRPFVLQPTLALEYAEHAESQSGFNDLWNVGFSDDGLRAVSTATDHRDLNGVLLFDAAAKKVRLFPSKDMLALVRPSEQDVPYCSISRAVIAPDGRTFAVRSVMPGHVVYLVDFDSCRLVGRLASDPGSEIDYLRFSPDGRYLAVGGRDGRVRVLEVATNRVAGSHEGTGRELLGMGFAKDGLRVMSGPRRDAGAKEAAPPHGPGEFVIWTVEYK